MGPQSSYAIEVEGSRTDYAKKTLAESLRRAGLLAGTTRIWVGFGAGKDKLEGQISISDATGHALAAFPVLLSNWGAGWQFKQGQIRDMIDQLARDVAYFLVRTARPGYKPPEDLEILFDDTPYPVPQKS